MTRDLCRYWHAASITLPSCNNSGGQGHNVFKGNGSFGQHWSPLNKTVTAFLFKKKWMLTRAAVLWGDEKMYCRIRWYYSSMTWCCYGSGTFLAVLSIIHSVPMSPTALEFQSTSFTITVAWFKASLNQLASPNNSIIAYKIKWNSKLWHSNEAGLLESKPHYAVGSQAHVWLGCSIDRSHPVLQNDGWKCFPKWPCLFIYLYLYPAFLMGPKVAHIKHKKHKFKRALLLQKNLRIKAHKTVYYWLDIPPSLQRTLALIWNKKYFKQHLKNYIPSTNAFFCFFCISSFLAYWQQTPTPNHWSVAAWRKLKIWAVKRQLSSQGSARVRIITDSQSNQSHYAPWANTSHRWGVWGFNHSATY